MTTTTYAADRTVTLQLVAYGEPLVKGRSEMNGSKKKIRLWCFMPLKHCSTNAITQWQNATGLRNISSIARIFCLDERDFSTW